MRLNGGVIGRANEPSPASAPGIWSAEEVSLSILYDAFPTRNRGWTLSNLLPQPRFLSNTGVLNVAETSPNSIEFKPDGTRMYMVGSTTDTVYQYDLSTPWDTTTLSYSGLSYNVAPQEINPQGVTFKPGGDRMYVVGTTGDDINEYTLSESWNVATASYVRVFSVSAQDLAPQEVKFKLDGTRMYVLGSTGDDVNEYELSEAWNVATASYTANYSVAAEEALPYGLAFSPDGTTMFVAGSNLDNVYQYSLSSAWSVNSATYSGAFYVGDRESSPTGVEFSAAGDRMYVIGSSGDDVNEYLVPAPWNIVSSRFSNTSFSVAAQATNPQGLEFKPDGTKMYIVDSTGDNVFQYSLSVPWDVSSASYDSKTFDFFQASIFDTGLGVAFKHDGSSMYISGYLSGTTAQNRIRQYILSTPWDVSTASFSAQSAAVSSIILFTDVFIDPLGINVYIPNNAGQIRHERMTTAWDISTSRLIGTYGGAIQSSISAIYFDPSGTSLFTASTGQDTVQQFKLSTPWDLSTMRYTGAAWSTVPFGAINPNGLAFKPDGKILYLVDNTLDRVLQFDLG